MTKKLFFTVLFLLQLAASSWGQTYTVKQIDSINRLSYDKIIANTQSHLTLFTKVLSDSKSQNYTLGVANAYENIALCYYYQSKFDIQSKYIFKSVNSYNTLKKYDKVASLYARYGYHLRLRNLNSALFYMQKGLKVAEKYNAKSELKAIYDNYGVLKEMKTEYDSAFLFYHKSLSLKEEVQDLVGIPYSLNKIGMLQLTLKDYVKAKQNLDKAYKIRLEIDDKVGIAESLNFYGWYYFETKDNKKSIYYFTKALEQSKIQNVNYLTQENYQKLSELYELNSDYKAALNNFKNHTAYKDSISNINLRIKQAELDTEFDTERKEKEILLQKADLAIKNTYLAIIISLLILSIIIGYFMLKNQKMKTLQLQKENELKQALLKIETQNRLQEQRLQISRDLHDNIGAQLTFIISSIENLKYGFSIEDEKLKNKLSGISAFTRSTITELRDTIWAMNKDEISFQDLKTRIANFIESAKTASHNINFEFNIDNAISDSLSFSSLKGINLYRVIQESVNNSLKHAEATLIKVNIEKEDNQINVTIADNGKGFDLNTSNLGNGIHNMKKRIKEVGGELTVDSTTQGTQIQIVLEE